MATVRILKTDISVTNINEVSEILINEKKIYTAICNANTLVRCYKDENLNKIINSFSIKCPDGFPVAKASKILYKNKQERVDGYKLFLETIKAGLNKRTTHYFYGNNEFTTKKMIEKLEKLYPEIDISGYYCPPILDSDQLLEKEHVYDLLDKKPDIIWVSLGFPKQEKFINLFRNSYNLDSNMIGVGAVFEWVAGTKYKAPEWIANLGFEWLLRLLQEPKRLFRRYLVDNFLFIIYFIRQYLSR